MMKMFLRILSRVLTQISLVIALGIVCIFLPQQCIAAEKFLTLPFEKNHHLMQGWLYDFGTKTHQGIDYYTEIGENLIATHDGHVRGYFQPGRNFVYGKYLVLEGSNGYKSLYAHLSEVVNVPYADSIKRGEVIARSGISGTDNSHLHFEVLSSFDNKRGLNRGFGWRIDPYDLYNFAKYYPGNKFYQSMGINHLWLGDFPSPPISKTPTLIAAKNGEDSAKIIWEKLEPNNLTKIELFRSGTKDGTQDSQKRVTLYSGPTTEAQEFLDKKIPPGNYYYSLLATYQNGLFVYSNEAEIYFERRIINLTEDKYWQGNPIVYKNMIFWEDRRKENDKPTKKLYYYNVDLGELGSANIGIDGVEFAYSLTANDDYVCFSAYDKYSATDHNIYCYSFITKNTFPVTYAKGHQYTPIVTESGLVVWVDKRLGTKIDLWALDLNGAMGEYPFNLEPGTQTNLAVWGDKIVWKDARNNLKYDLYLKDGDLPEQLLATSLGSGGVDIWEDWVIWVSGGLCNAQNYATGESFKINTNFSSPTVRIGYGKIVYASPANSLFDLYIYDISAKSTEKIELGAKYYPVADLGPNFVVFDVHPNPQNTGDKDVYLIML